MKYDVIVEVNKADRIVEVEKFNPYHDSKGRFASANSAASFTYSPGKSKAHDNAIAREKERQAAAPSGTKEAVANAKTKPGEFDVNVRGKTSRRQSGEIDEAHGIAYHDAYADEGGGGWRATDLASGMGLSSHYDTLKECQAAMAQKWDSLKDIRAKDSYKEAVEQFNAIKLNAK